MSYGRTEVKNQYLSPPPLRSGGYNYNNYKKWETESYNTVLMSSRYKKQTKSGMKTQNQALRMRPLTEKPNPTECDEKLFIKATG